MPKATAFVNFEEKTLPLAIRTWVTIMPYVLRKISSTVATFSSGFTGKEWREILKMYIKTKDTTEYFEKLGLDVCWVAEAWGSDAPSPLGFLAARTERMLLGAGVMQVGTRTPATIAMTALTLATLSEGRFLLGLGSSGPQVIEGLHGLAFDHPVGRMRETVDVIRRVCAVTVVRISQ